MAEKFTFIHLPEVLVNARSHPDQGSIKLAPVAMTECNTLLARFVSSLRREELTSGKRKRTCYRLCVDCTESKATGILQGGTMRYAQSVKKSCIHESE